MVSLTKYRERLPILGKLKPVFKSKQATYYEVRMREAYHSFHSEMPTTRIWGYEGMYPGPVIEVRRNEKVLIKWDNQLPQKHFLPVDKSFHGLMDLPEVRTVVHVHGAKVRPESDGYPEAWYTKDFEQTGPHFEREIYCYTNRQAAATLWYHDHALGITRLNVYTGLAGFYLIRDSLEQKLNLPRGSYEIPLMIQDRSFNPDGSLFYPHQPPGGIPGVEPSITPGVDGETIVVNGKVWPYLPVEPRKYRFRLLNASNHRFYRMRFDPVLPIYQIGTDGGFLAAPVKLWELMLAPGERADVIVDFSGCQGKHLVLRNDAPSPFPNGTPVNPETTGEIMEFRVVLPLKGEDTSCIPKELSPVIPLDESRVKVRRDLRMMIQRDEYGRLIFLLNGKGWHDPATEEPYRGEVEVWNLINPGFASHPIHLHQIQFQILNRQPFDVARFNQTQELVFTGPAVPPAPNERGWKDTVRTNPGEVTRIIFQFGPFTGPYVWHCHLLEHEDYDMMRPMNVLSKKDGKKPGRLEIR